MTAVLGRCNRAVLPRRDGGTTVTHGLLDVLAAWGIHRIYCCPAALRRRSWTRSSPGTTSSSYSSPTNPWRSRWPRGMRGPLAARPSPTPHQRRNGERPRAPVVRAAFSCASCRLNGLKAATLAGGVCSLAGPPEGHGPAAREVVAYLCGSERVTDDVDHALHAAVAEPAGPVWLGVPQDLLEADVTGPSPGTRRAAASALTRPSSEAVLAAADAGRRPAPGAGGRRRGSAQARRQAGGGAGRAARCPCLRRGPA